MNISKIANTTKIIVLNVLFILIVLVVIDYSLYLKLKHNYLKDTEHPELFPPISYIENYKADFSQTTLMFQNGKTNNFDYFRPISGKEYKNKNSILIFGCSFAYSFGLEDNQTISEKLSQFTKRTIYNFGICACGIQHMYRLITFSNEALFKKITNPPSHVIYIYIPSHIQRLQSNMFPSPLLNNGRNLQYKIENDTLKENFSWFDAFSKTFLVKTMYYQKDLAINFYDSNIKDENSKLAYKLFSESKKKLQEKYPNIKFIILRYEIIDDYDEQMEEPQMWEELKNDGFIILKSSDLIGIKYKYHSEDTNQDGCHPSEYAWDLLIPPLVKELNL